MAPSVRGGRVPAHAADRTTRRDLPVREVPSGEGGERQQIKWFASAAALTFAWIFVFEQLLRAEGGVLEAIAAVSSLVVVPSIPIATGIAILRYRACYELD